MPGRRAHRTPEGRHTGAVLTGALAWSGALPVPCRRSGRHPPRLRPVRRRRRLPGPALASDGVVQLPAAVWGALVEWSGWVCPLTPLENWLRAQGGAAGYAGGFVERYLLPALYPASLTRGVQILLGAGALAANLIAYARVRSFDPVSRFLTDSLASNVGG